MTYRLRITPTNYPAWDEDCDTLETARLRAAAVYGTVAVTIIDLATHTDPPESP